MVRILPFKGVRPAKPFVLEMSAPPYDVINSEEARELANGKDKSYLRISRPEVDFPASVDEHDDKVYAQGKVNYDLFKKNGWLLTDTSPCYYIYKQVMGVHTQIGIVAVADVEDYDTGRIKKHEFTRPDKEDDRTRHVDEVGANTEPVFFTYKANPEIDGLVEKWTKEKTPEYDFKSDDGVHHVLWKCDDTQSIKTLESNFANTPYMYIADGHHRSAAASRVQKMRKERNTKHSGKEEYNTFLTVVFPDNQMNIMAYNRIVKDLNGLTAEAFLRKISDKFEVIPNASDVPGENLAFSMYLEGRWYLLKARKGSFDANDAVKRLDASILQENLLHPVLGIANPRTDTRINFVGGIRGTKELKKHVDSGKYQVAFSLHPVTIKQLMDVADSGQVMPPKSTWFEPKLRSGLFIHELD
jgi:uncharacterized protein (DUF1015 family)